jgi:hypothetical protein
MIRLRFNADGSVAVLVTFTNRTKAIITVPAL